MSVEGIHALEETEHGADSIPAHAQHPGHRCQARCPVPDSSMHAQRSRAAFSDHIPQLPKSDVLWFKDNRTGLLATEELTALPDGTFVIHATDSEAMYASSAND